MPQLAILDARAGSAWGCGVRCAQLPERLVEVAGRFVGPWSEVVLAEASSALEVIPLLARSSGFHVSSAASERLACVWEQMRLQEAHRQRSWHWELCCTECATRAALLPGSSPELLGVETPRRGRRWERSVHPLELDEAAPRPGLGAGGGLERVFATGAALEGGSVRERSKIPTLWCGVGRARGGALSYTDWVLTDGRCLLRSPEGEVLPYVPGDPVECYLGEPEDSPGSGFALSCAVDVVGGSWAAQVRETRIGEETSQLLQQLVVVGAALPEASRALRAALGGL